MFAWSLHTLSSPAVPVPPHLALCVSSLPPLCPSPSHPCSFLPPNPVPHDKETEPRDSQEGPPGRLSGWERGCGDQGLCRRDREAAQSTQLLGQQQVTWLECGAPMGHPWASCPGLPGRQLVL